MGRLQAMHKAEFLETLREALSGNMQEGKIAAHMQYYQDYIERQIRNGRSEEEILTELGDPRLIAKTLLDTDGGQSYYEEYQEYSQPQERKKQFRKTHIRKLDLSSWYGKAAVILLAALAIIIILVIAGVLIPIFLVVLAVAFIISILKKS